MKLPKSVTIFGQKVIVSVGPLDESTAGMYEPQSKVILINEKQSSRELDITLIHEMVHALAYRLNWNGSMSAEQIEFACDHVATMIVENFKLSKRK